MLRKSLRQSHAHVVSGRSPHNAIFLISASWNSVGLAACVVRSATFRSDILPSVFRVAFQVLCLLDEGRYLFRIFRWDGFDASFLRLARPGVVRIWSKGCVGNRRFETTSTDTQKHNHFQSGKRLKFESSMHYLALGVQTMKVLRKIPS